LEGLEDRCVPVRYLTEPRPGISHARNTGVAAAGDLIAFIDDDNIPASNWLAMLLQTRARLQADAVFGRIVGLPLTGCTARQARLSARFDRDLGPTARLLGTTERARVGTGNSLFCRKTCFIDRVPFNVALGLTGGEDTAFIGHLSRQGRLLGWAPEAAVLELVAPDRLTRESICRRRFKDGQCRVRFTGTFGTAHCARWMAVGIAQCMSALPLTLALDLLRQPALADAAWGEAWGGLGKVLWWSEMQPSYGELRERKARHYSALILAAQELGAAPVGMFLAYPGLSG